MLRSIGVMRQAYVQQCTVVATMVKEVEDQSVPTRLPGWSCGVLLGHLTAGTEALWRWQGDSTQDRVKLDAISYWDPVTSFADSNSAWAIEYAARRTPADLTGEFLQAIEFAKRYVSGANAASPIIPPVGVAWLRFDQFLATRILELTVHGLDLADATGQPVSPASKATDVTAAVLDQRLAGPRPDDLIDDVRWIEAATGRASHDDERLPVLA